MSYYAYDAAGYVGDLASIGGLQDLERAVAGRSAALEKLFEDGFTENIAEVRNALAGITLLQQEVDETRRNMINLLGRSEGVFIISEGYTPS